MIDSLQGRPQASTSTVRNLAKRAGSVDFLSTPTFFRSTAYCSISSRRSSRAAVAWRALGRDGEPPQIAQARATDTGAQGWRQRFAWPRLGRVSGLFGAQRIYNGEPGAYHSGVDIAGATGEPVRAPADGVVILAADHPFTLEGNLLMIDHGQGLNSAFLHLSRIDVKNGEAVHQGQVIGAIGATGRATGPHLHWSMKWRDARIDPMALAGPMPAATPR